MTPPQVLLRPRRLGHVNLWVSDLERSILFYERTCGIELVRRERDLLIGFHSNGNTHHDVGMVEVSRGQDRYGRDGTLQIPKHRGTATGLNHLGWEMESEELLVQAYRRAIESGVTVQRAVDHLISHSLYLTDPDGNGHEFYADEMRDWRSIYNLDREDEVTGLWDPLAAPPKTVHNYNVDPPIRRVEAAPVHPSHLTDAAFATRRYDAMKAFFLDVAGMSLIDEQRDGRRTAFFAGATGRLDLVLDEAGDDEPTGLRAFSFVLTEPTDLQQAAHRLNAAGTRASVQSRDGRQVLRLQDPDGFEIDLRSPA